MSGISGFLNLDGAPVLPERLHRMAGLMAHRGPDGATFTAFPSDHTLPALAWQDRAKAPADSALQDAAFAMIHLRLGVGTVQPLATSDDRYWVVLDGEIANREALRKELPGAGAGDAEVLVSAWAAWGERCLERLDGAFAFAIWDRPGQRLFLARDRFGLKPLYYAEGDRALAFASEIKPVLAGLSLAPKPCEAVVQAFLVHGTRDSGPGTFFEGVLQVPPGHLVAVKARVASPRAYEAIQGMPPPVYDLPRLSGADAAGFFDALPDLLWYREEPFDDVGPYLQWLGFKVDPGGLFRKPGFLDGLKAWLRARDRRALLTPALRERPCPAKVAKRPCPDPDFSGSSWIGEARRGRLASFLDDLARGDSPWIDWLRVGERTDILPFLIAELWRRQIASPDYLAPRAPRLDRG